MTNTPKEQWRLTSSRSHHHFQNPKLLAFSNRCFLATWVFGLPCTCNTGNQSHEVKQTTWKPRGLSIPAPLSACGERHLRYLSGQENPQQSRRLSILADCREAFLRPTRGTEGLLRRAGTRITVLKELPFPGQWERRCGLQGSALKTCRCPALACSPGHRPAQPRPDPSPSSSSSLPSSTRPDLTCAPPCIQSTMARPSRALAQ